MVATLKKLLSAKQVAATIESSESTVWRLDANGTLPKCIKISKGMTRWDGAEIDAWLESKKAARAGAETLTAKPSAPTPRCNPVAPTTRPDAKRPGRPRKYPAAQVAP